MPVTKFPFEKGDTIRATNTKGSVLIGVYDEPWPNGEGIHLDVDGLNFSVRHGTTRGCWQFQKIAVLPTKVGAMIQCEGRVFVLADDAGRYPWLTIEHDAEGDWVMSSYFQDRDFVVLFEGLDVDIRKLREEWK